MLSPQPVFVNGGFSLSFPKKSDGLLAEPLNTSMLRHEAASKGIQRTADLLGRRMDYN
jgi:hypothetical protein